MASLKRLQFRFLQCRNCFHHQLHFASNVSSKKLCSADVVICGGGLSGCSVAYHLAKLGKNVVVFERDFVGCAGATSVCSGLMTSPINWQNSTNQYMNKLSMDLYTDLASTSKFRFERCGRLYLAHSLTSEIGLRRIYSDSKLLTEEAELIDDAGDLFERWPVLLTEDVQLALLSMSDISLDPIGLTQALMHRAKEYSAKFYEQTAVNEVVLGDDGEVVAVHTDKGIVETSRFVDAAGIWCGNMLVRDLPRKQVEIAAYPCTYTYMKAGKLKSPCLEGITPIFTDVDEGLWIRANEYVTAFGTYDGQIVKSVKRQHEEMPDWQIPDADWDAFYPSLDKALKRMSIIGQLECGGLTRGAEHFTPDKFPVVGETAQAHGYYVVTGLSGQGLAWAGGIGKILADMMYGTPEVDVTKIEVTRFINLHTGKQYLMERTPDVAGKVFKRTYRSHQFGTARKLRTSPIHQQMTDAGAVFGEVMGYERPLWFLGKSEITKTRNPMFSGQDDLIGRPEWFSRVAKEYEACRERVGLIDLSSYAKFDVMGPDCVKLLQWLCSANIDVPVGSMVYSGMQNEMGGYVTDCTISRIGKKHYFIIAPTVQQLRLPMWIQKWIFAKKYNVTLQDVTGLYTALAIVGPSSRSLMHDITGEPMSTSDFPQFTIRVMNIGIAAGVRALSVTHCGELGWVLYIPNEVAQSVYERIVKAGQEFSLTHAGYYTLRQLRIEKFYVYWGEDINPKVTPVECGRSFRVSFEKEFIGKEALLNQMKNGVRKRFVQLLVDRHDLDSDPWPQGGETIYRNGVIAGRTTSAAYGFTLGCQICLGYIENSETGVTPEYITKGSYEVEIANSRFPTRVNLNSPTLPMISSELGTHYLATR